MGKWKMEKEGCKMVKKEGWRAEGGERKEKGHEKWDCCFLKLSRFKFTRYSCFDQRE